MKILGCSMEIFQIAIYAYTSDLLEIVLKTLKQQILKISGLDSFIRRFSKAFFRHYVTNYLDFKPKSCRFLSEKKRFSSIKDLFRFFPKKFLHTVFFRFSVKENLFPSLKVASLVFWSCRTDEIFSIKWK